MEAPPANNNGTARYWCITIHKINDVDIEDIVNDQELGVEFLRTFFEEAVGKEQRIAYFVGQLERGGGGRLHLQCYLELRGSGGVRGSAIRGMLGLGGTPPPFVYPAAVSSRTCLYEVARAYDYRMDILLRFELCNDSKG